MGIWSSKKKKKKNLQPWGFSGCRCQPLLCKEINIDNRWEREKYVNSSAKITQDEKRNLWHFKLQILKKSTKSASWKQILDTVSPPEPHWRIKAAKAAPVPLPFETSFFPFHSFTSIIGIGVGAGAYILARYSVSGASVMQANMFCMPKGHGQILKSGWLDHLWKSQANQASEWLASGFLTITGLRGGNNSQWGFSCLSCVVFGWVIKRWLSNYLSCSPWAGMHNFPL